MESKNKNWWDGLEAGAITQMKFNTTPLALCPDWMQGAFVLCERKDLLRLIGIQTASWKTPALENADALPVEATYRLRPDWQTPPKKEGRWEYCEVRKGEYLLCANWVFSRRQTGSCPLMAATSMVGFGGIEYKERPNVWYVTAALTAGSDVLFGWSNNDTDKPATPVRVRFWVEE